jgi:hypothetical protein
MASGGAVAGGDDTSPGAELDDISCKVAQHRLRMLAEEGGFRASRSAGSPFVMGLGSCVSATL